MLNLKKTAIANLPWLTAAALCLALSTPAKAEQQWTETVTKRIENNISLQVQAKLDALAAELATSLQKKASDQFFYRELDLLMEESSTELNEWLYGEDE